ncbi:hypothetical protein [Microbispora triticiradicis]|uniref:hypothetical protein n=1 Tax=Microbispora triticiradicis TaxID=2200763 RepID=UPI001AD63839|nr:hypothetical protein [Microbispora triticiradicis]MBO4269832.1 hypothetical protein [Microbispora triticiradicis]
MSRSPNGTALGALGSLLDASLLRIAEASADARTYDRRAIYEIADVWDNNTFPLFHAATARTSIGRERRARAALAWMADLGLNRRSWMVEQAEGAGRPLEQILPPPVAEPAHTRNHRGLVTPQYVPLTAEAALGLSTDYDLAAARVRTLLLERAGTRLTGFLVLAAPRRYDGGPLAVKLPELHLRLEDVTDVGFDSDDRMAATLRCGTAGIALQIGTSGRLHAAGGSVYPDDPFWHLSTAGRAADKRTPACEEQVRRTPERRRPQLEGSVLVAARILHSVMLEIRMVRYAYLADQVPVRLLAGAVTGAGTNVIAAGARRGRRRETAFRDLVESWSKNADSTLTPWFTDRLRHLTGTEQFPDSTNAWIEGITTPGPTLPHLGTAPAVDRPPSGELRFATYTAAHLSHGTPRRSSAVVVVAHPSTEQSPPNQPWRLRAFRFDDVSRFRLQADAFDGLHGLRTAAETQSAEVLILGHDALDVRGRALP